MTAFYNSQVKQLRRIVKQMKEQLKLADGTEERMFQTFSGAWNKLADAQADREQVVENFKQLLDGEFDSNLDDFQKNVYEAAQKESILNWKGKQDEFMDSEQESQKKVFRGWRDWNKATEGDYRELLKGQTLSESDINIGSKSVANAEKEVDNAISIFNQGKRGYDLTKEQMLARVLAQQQRSKAKLDNYYDDAKSHADSTLGKMALKMNASVVKEVALTKKEMDDDLRRLFKQNSDAGDGFEETISDAIDQVDLMFTELEAEEEKMRKDG